MLNENYRLPQEYIYNEKLSTENLLKENYQLKRMRNKKLSTEYLLNENYQLPQEYLLNKNIDWIFAQQKQLTEYLLNESYRLPQKYLLKENYQLNIRSTKIIVSQ